jgi:hypothetical protein
MLRAKGPSAAGRVLLSGLTNPFTMTPPALNTLQRRAGPTGLSAPDAVVLEPGGWRPRRTASAPPGRARSIRARRIINDNCVHYAQIRCVTYMSTRPKPLGRRPNAMLEAHRSSWFSQPGMSSEEPPHKNGPVCWPPWRCVNIPMMDQIESTPPPTETAVPDHSC